MSNHMAKTEDHGSGAVLRVLILEDVPRDADLAERELRKAGLAFESVRVDTREDFLAALEGAAPDIVISDYNLPDFDGMAALLLTQERAPATPVIIVTGSMNEEVAVECMKAGAADYVIKEHLIHLGPAVTGALAATRTKMDRQRSEETARSSAREWQATFDAMTDAICLLDLEGTILRCNRAMQEFLGKPATEIIGCTCWELVHGTSEPVEGCPWARARKSRVKERLLLQVGELWLDVTVDPMLDEAGNVIGGIHMVSDVTAERQAQEALRFMQFAVDHAGDAAYWMGPDARLLYVNDTARRSLGYSREELLGMTVHDIDPNFPKEAWADHWANLKRHGNLVIESVYRRKNGQEFPVEIALSYQAFENKDYNFALARDITERKRAEEVLARREEQYRALFEESRDALMTIAPPSWKFTSANRSGVAMFGARDLSEFTSLGPWDVSPEFQPDGRLSAEKAPEMIDTAMREGFHFFEWTHKRVDGQVFPATVLLTRIELGGETLLYATVRDITERKRAEEERYALEVQLRQSQKLEAIGTLAGGIAHDFNNLLMGIMNYVELCRDAVGPDHPAHKWLDEISTDSERTANLTRQLLAFARKQTIVPKALDLNDAISGMLTLLRRLLGEDIDLAWQPGTALWPVEMDPSQLDQVLVNLTVNARDAIGDVGKLTIETMNITLDEAYCAEHVGTVSGDYVTLVVSDDGCGMDKDVLEHLFEPFFTTKEFGKGTGLGLPTVHGIVNQNDGFVNVYSEPGEGTTFRICLRRFAGDLADESGTEQKTPTERIDGDETILLVEDEKSIRVTAKLFLQHLGYTVLAADCPAEALRLAAAHAGEIQLLITDVVMPGMNGRDLAERLAQDRPLMKRLFMSGYTASVIAHRGVLDEKVAFLPKPFTRAALTLKVREVLDA